MNSNQESEPPLDTNNPDTNPNKTITRIRRKKKKARPPNIQDDAEIKRQEELLKQQEAEIKKSIKSKSDMEYMNNNEPEEVKMNKSIPADAKSTRSNPQDSQNVPSKPQDVKSNMTKPQDVKSNRTKPQDAKSNMTKPQDARSNLVGNKSNNSIGLPTFGDATTYDAKKAQVFVPPADYSKYNIPDDVRSIRSKNSQMTNGAIFATDVVNPIRVVLPPNINSDEITDMLCKSCQLFPLIYESCSECQAIYCKSCSTGKKKCSNCNSIYKTAPLKDRMLSLFTIAQIKCSYYDIGCRDTLPSAELIKHEKVCKITPIKCKFCWKDFNYSTIQQHWNECEKNRSTCEKCGYSDLPAKFTQTTQMTNHLKHELEPVMRKMIQEEFVKFNMYFKEMLSSIPQGNNNNTIVQQPHDDTSAAQLLLLQEMMKKLNEKPVQVVQPLHASNEPDKRLKSIELLFTLATDIDNAFECDKKFIVLSTYKHEYYVIYPTSRYGIQSFNLSTNTKGYLIKKAHGSNIICMAYIHNPKESLTFFATASYDRSIKIWCIEKEWKLVAQIPDAHADYSIFAIEMIYDDKLGIVKVISGNYSNKEVKIWKIDGSCEDTIKCKNNVASIACRTPTDLFIGTSVDIEQYELPSKKMIRNYTSTPPSKHTSIVFAENSMVETDSFGKLRVWNLSSGQMIFQIERGILKHQINSVCIWDNRYVVCGTRDNRLMLYDIFDGVCIDEIGAHNGYVYCVKSADHWKHVKVIISSGFDGELKLWGSKV